MNGVQINGRTVFNNSDINTPDIDGGIADDIVIGLNTPAAGFFTNISSGANTVFLVDGIPDPLLGSITDVAIDKNSGDIYVKETVVTTTTWNPLDKSEYITLSNGNLTAVCNTSFTVDSVRSVVGVPYGKFYWEITMDDLMAVYSSVGIGTPDADVNVAPGSDVHGYGYRNDGGSIHNGIWSSFGNTYTNGDIISTALDMDNKKIWWAKNGIWQNGGNPETETNEAYNNLNGTFHSMDSPGYTAGVQITANFGETPFAFPVPLGFSAGIGATVLTWVKKTNQTQSKIITPDSPITNNVTWTDIIPAKYELEKIIFVESAGNSATLNLGTTAGANDVFANHVITADTITTIVLNKTFSLSDVQSLFLNDDSPSAFWNGASLSATLLVQKVI